MKSRVSQSVLYVGIALVILVLTYGLLLLTYRNNPQDISVMPSASSTRIPTSKKTPLTQNQTINKLSQADQDVQQGLDQLDINLQTYNSINISDDSRSL